ncbi:SDR family oxidoreductase [Saccharothrix coeruleofusca]|uniref:Oxidoreductase n=1 Tax=Saccharothrix coeruleofusca TaxID=33919 RepID=A0A918EIJ7_9PSEU|nr:SDR family oxidoreductase [Saccharothrix coeruleofusca]GGP86611.1 oxidoreductase [Saccharothrix coeruleofusca]
MKKVVLITGASSGIGAATARALAGAGHQVVLGARRVDRLRELAESIGGDHRALDVTSLSDFQSFVDYAAERHGRVDVLVNNAGVMPLSRLDEGRVEEWNRMLDVNVRGVLNGIAATLPGMKERRSGHIINVASIGAHEVSPVAAVYCGTKFAVWAISEGLRQEATEGVRVSTISPGVTESELADSITSPEAREAMREYRKIAIPASAVASAIAFAIDQPSEVDVSEIVVRPAA